MKRRDLIGQQFGRLVALRCLGSDKRRHSIWECQCQCGTIVTVNSNNLIQNNTKSCGCLIKDANAASLQTKRFAKRRRDLAGQRFGRLVVLRYVANTTRGHATWECKCDCGSCVIVKGDNLIRGNTRSCGCLVKETSAAIGRSKVLHGGSRVGAYHPEYRSWTSMKSRCLNTNHHAYADYGGRGIKVCDRWLNSYENFLSDMGRRPTLTHTLDRWPDNDGDYEPANCRWATRSEQRRNSRPRKNVVVISRETEDVT